MKAAFLCLYWGLFRRVQGKVRWLLNFAIALTVCCFLIAEVGVLTWCHPIEINWLVLLKAVFILYDLIPSEGEAI